MRDLKATHRLDMTGVDRLSRPYWWAEWVPSTVLLRRPGTNADIDVLLPIAVKAGLDKEFDNTLPEPLGMSDEYLQLLVDQGAHVETLTR